MPAETAPNTQWMRQTLGALVVFSGLCTVLALVLTASEAWQEHARERWPQVTAHVDSCGLERVSTGEECWRLRESHDCTRQIPQMRFRDRSGRFPATLPCPSSQWAWLELRPQLHSRP
jgi:hypothetical protein